MKLAIRYFTKSKKGNTKKMADAASKSLGIEALSVENDLPEKTEKLFLINAMYAANIDKEIKAFLERNKDNIGCLININTSASGGSTYKVVSKCAQKYGIPMSDKEFHCQASWLGLNKGRPNEDDFAALDRFLKEIVA